MTTAKFWHFHNSAPVLIKIKAGQSLRHWHGGPTDEGWFSEANVWSFDGDVLTSEWYSDGRDCDGLLSQHAKSVCRADELRDGNSDPEYSGVIYPAWEHVTQGQRDYSAEAAGY